MQIVSAFPDPLPVEANIDFSTFFDKVVRPYENIPLLFDPEANISYKFSELRFLVHRFIIAFNKGGLKQEDVIATVIGNSIEFIALFLACCKQRLIFCPLNTSYKINELLTYLSKVNPVYLIVDQEFNKDSSQILETISSIKAIYQIENLMMGSPLLNNENPYQLIEFDNKTPALIMFSSGSTGIPKPVLISHRSLIYQINMFICLRQNATHDFLFLQPTDTTYGVLPYFHLGGLMTTLTMLVQSVKVLLNKKFNEEIFYDNIQKYRVTTLTIVPEVLKIMANSTKIDKYDVSSLKYIYYGSSKCNPGIVKKLKKKFPHIELFIQLYGSTEGGSTIFMMPKIPEAHEKINSVGVLLPGIQCKLIPINENENESAVNGRESGELYLKSDMLMNGYLTNDISSIDKNGWLKTGDIVSVDNEGFFYVSGRCKEIIKIRGWQVSPNELEYAIIEEFIDKIEECAVTLYEKNICDDNVESYLVCLVVLKKEQTLNGEDIIKFVRDNFISYKHIKEPIKFVECLPKTCNGKLLRHKLSELYDATPSNDSV
ncbi:Acyl-CoA synthetase family member 2, mitochondrial [Strongyloides ratti]|uniref:Acyl-CoA synthetase family member 2, mitochondrial n=1 Tax=Strongyloides ratti TaxID=34506 RepID=A0A090L651_STRRB|nr:Acyl-CoA synthetase family member 2, mitochondrial [Strongyloides ratti]CEF65266.1 Acyl-CoA synthetase family member 2, mitochondrial [Strongyloides ratti]